MPWIVAIDDVMYLSTEHFPGPHIWNEPGAECWSYPDSADDPLIVPPGCYHVSMNPEDAQRWDSRADAERIARAATEADLDVAGLLLRLLRHPETALRHIKTIVRRSYPSLVVDHLIELRLAGPCPRAGRHAPRQRDESTPDLVWTQQSVVAPDYGGAVRYHDHRP